MNLLLDYRPALTRRTGVGEYAHELAAALSRTARPQDRLTLFTSSWRDRPDPSLREWPAVTVVDRRVPVRLLNWAWHRRQWPPIEWLAGPVRRRRLDASAGAAHTGRTSGHHHPRPRFPAASGAHDCRDPARLLAHWFAITRSSAALVVVNSADTARAVQLELQVPAERIVLCRPGPAGLDRTAGRPARACARATCCLSGRSSRARTSARCSTRGRCW